MIVASLLATLSSLLAVFVDLPHGLLAHHSPPLPLSLPPSLSLRGLASPCSDAAGAFLTGSLNPKNLHCSHFRAIKESDCNGKCDPFETCGAMLDWMEGQAEYDYAYGDATFQTALEKSCPVTCETCDDGDSETPSPSTPAPPGCPVLAAVTPAVCATLDLLSLPQCTPEGLAGSSVGDFCEGGSGNCGTTNDLNTCGTFVDAYVVVKPAPDPCAVEDSDPAYCVAYREYLTYEPALTCIQYSALASPAFSAWPSKCSYTCGCIASSSTCVDTIACDDEHCDEGGEGECPVFCGLCVDV